MSNKHTDRIGVKIYELIKELFPICRSISGNGVRETLKKISEIIPIVQTEVPSNTPVFDWTIPEEWNIKDAYIKNSQGVKIVDFKKNNLHILGYSEPYTGILSLNELKNHLYTLPDQPELIPYVTSYYKRRWGFCITHKQMISLDTGDYEVFIDTSLEPGSLTYAELLIPGKIRKEIFLSSYICHPSMANNELSGPAVLTYLADYLMRCDNYYSYRIVFVPETIGSIAYISKNINILRENVIGGYVITCCGDKGKFSYLKTRGEKSITDRVTIHTLKNSNVEFNEYSFLTRGSDERQYNAPGVDLQIGSLMKSKYGEYPEYHTSADNLDFIDADSLADSFNMYKKCLSVFENNFIYSSNIKCEPQLGKRGLYPDISMKDSATDTINMMNFLAYCNGESDLIEISENIGINIFELLVIVKKLFDNKIIARTNS